MSALFNNPATRLAVEKNLLNVAVQDGYAGIDLELESLAPADQFIFTKYATTVMPISKILLGLAAYGYDWNTTTGASATDCSIPTIDALIAQYHVTPSWDSTNAAPYFTYTDASGDSHTVYYENSASLEPKLQLATQFNLAGVAIWQAGSESQAFLGTLQAWAGSA
ncbi:MAG: hypothetical protein A2201_08810 [Alicyclobacillus sp. RIFOXYA1_FULL_53_8]|nr:MAG: hypothetical protein A2201_08810 [Alicyclobacillus sp. RIFOXYA1_FULL_53_8]